MCILFIFFGYFSDDYSKQRVNGYVRGYPLSAGNGRYPRVSVIRG